MVVYLSPIGYDSTRVTRPVLSEGIDDGDRIILLRPKEDQADSRAEEAINDVERMVTQVQPQVSVETKYITHNEFEAAVVECSDLITEGHDSLVVNLGGGPREVYLPVLTALLAHPDAVKKVLQFSDLDGSVSRISLPRISGGVSQPALATLQSVVRSKTEIGIPELADDLDKAKSTVSRHIQELERAEAVRTEMHGKTKVVMPTVSGVLRARMGQ
jgi:CRISPR-associated protein Csa3